MKRHFIILISIFFFSCTEKKEELTVIQKANKIIMNSEISVDEKYDSIYKNSAIDYNSLTPKQKADIGKLFFSVSSNANIEVLADGKLNLYIRGNVKSNFKNKRFEKYTFNVVTDITMGNKSFTSGQIFTYDNYEFEALNFELHHKLINDIEAMNGGQDFIWLDKSFLKHKPKSCIYAIELVAENKVGESVRVLLFSEDFSMLWEENSPYLYYR